MREYFTRKEMDELEGTAEHVSVGSTIRINHDTHYCSGSSNSLLIRRDSDGFSVKCFRCGRSGKRSVHNLAALKGAAGRKGIQQNENMGGVNERVSSAISAAIQGVTEGDGRFVEDLRAFGLHARVWINKYGITEREVRKYGICYDTERDKLIFPVFDADGFVGYLARAVLPTDTDPKYLTFMGRQSIQLCADVGADMERIVLTEDTISAIKTGRYVLSMPLNTTTIQDKHKDYILSSGIKETIVWLDDDNLQVKRQQVALKRELDKITNCRLIATGKDPKHHTDDEIKRMLTCV